MILSGRNVNASTRNTCENKHSRLRDTSCVVIITTPLCGLLYYTTILKSLLYSILFVRFLVSVVVFFFVLGIVFILVRVVPNFVRFRVGVDVVLCRVFRVAQDGLSRVAQSPVLVAEHAVVS